MENTRQALSPLMRNRLCPPPLASVAVLQCHVWVPPSLSLGGGMPEAPPLFHWGGPRCPCASCPLHCKTWAMQAEPCAPPLCSRVPGRAVLAAATVRGAAVASGVAAPCDQAPLLSYAGAPWWRGRQLMAQRQGRQLMHAIMTGANDRGQCQGPTASPSHRTAMP